MLIIKRIIAKSSILYHLVTLKAMLVRRRTLWLVGLLSFVAVACGEAAVNPSISPSVNVKPPLTIWWEKGFNLEEDEALQKVVMDWEDQTGNPVNLTFQTTDDFPQKTQRAMQAGTPPDIVMSHNAERGLYPRLAWEGKLVDLSDVVEPIKDLYPASILEGIRLYNSIDQQRRDYTVPFSQSSNFIFYWQDLVEQAGYQKSDVPQEWDAFWSFWRSVQDKLRQQAKTTAEKNINGLGFSFSGKAGDTYYLFEQILEAYDVQILTPDGKLHGDDPAVRQGIIKSLKWYTDFYQRGDVPQDSTKWLNPDNNDSLLNRAVVMTPNTSLTIPAALRQDEDAYFKKLVTQRFPNKPSGQPMRHILTIKQAVIFTEAKNQELAKAFLSYFIQPETINAYLKAAGIRNMPIAKPLWKDPYWMNPKDTHITIGNQVLNSADTRPFPTVYHPAYSVVTQENVWGNAIQRIVEEGVTPEQAADDAITQIKRIFAEWK
jgi:multiple sugar transport system substrate-binding protein